MDQLLQYATNRIIELESLLLVDIQETVWPTEVKNGFFLRLITPGDLPAHHQRRLLHHINRMWLEKMPESDTFLAASEPGPIAFAFR
ncbi:hypothetical protein ABT70_11885 [Salmonella enterica subsp. enterica serovar Typhimurium]|nr:hypothetical protein ABT70_11885 [Salmonella enterica subsp. enterica serovar Typhimurium]